MTRKTKLASAPKRPALAKGSYRYDVDGRLRPQAIMICDKRLPRDWRNEPVVVEIHHYLSLQEARPAFDEIVRDWELKLEGTSSYERHHAHNDVYHVYIAAPTFRCNAGETARLYRRSRSDRWRTPVNHVYHFIERKRKGVWTYEPLPAGVAGIIKSK